MAISGLTAWLARVDKEASLVNLPTMCLGLYQTKTGYAAYLIGGEGNVLERGFRELFRAEEQHGFSMPGGWEDVLGEVRTDLHAYMDSLPENATALARAESVVVGFDDGERLSMVPPPPAK